MLIPRPYQQAAVDAIRTAYAAGHRSVLIVLATGLGKTVIAALIAAATHRRGGRLLFVAHRRELLAQALRKFAEAGVHAELEQGRHNADHDAPVVVASVDTLRGKRLESWAPDAFSVLVVDEAHRSLSPTHRKIIGHFAAARVLGLTATPQRLDGQALGDVYDAVTFEYGLRDAIRDEWLVPLVARRVQLESVDLSAVRVVGGDLDPVALAEAMSEERALHGVAVPLLRESAGRRTVAFTADVRHAVELARVLNSYAPGVAAAVHGDMRPADRQSILDEYRAGRVRVITNCALLVEGWDDPPTSCVAMARPTKSWALYVQAIGRGTRCSDETGKRDCLILDFTGLCGKHRLAGPADALAGSLVTEEQRALLDEWLRAGCVDLEGALVRAAAEAQEQARAEAASAEARYRVEELDPWISYLQPTADDGIPATAKQLAALIDAGVKPRDGLTSAQAIAILAAVAERKAAGRCSVKLAKMLAARNVPRAAELSRAEANALFQALRSTGYAYIPRRVLHAIRPELAQPVASGAAA